MLRLDTYLGKYLGKYLGIQSKQAYRTSGREARSFFGLPDRWPFVAAISDRAKHNRRDKRPTARRHWLQDGVSVWGRWRIRKPTPIRLHPARREEHRLAAWGGRKAGVTGGSWPPCQNDAPIRTRRMRLAVARVNPAFVVRICTFSWLWWQVQPRSRLHLTQSIQAVRVASPPTTTTSPAPPAPPFSACSLCHLGQSTARFPPARSSPGRHQHSTKKLTSNRSVKVQSRRPARWSVAVSSHLTRTTHPNGYL